MPERIAGGVYPPLPTFFTETEELDLVTYQRHIHFLREQGITGYVVMGSNGEAVHLTSDERAQVIEAARQAAGREATIIAGCGEQSTRATIANCQLAARCGADVALILPPFYYRGGMSSTALIEHYRKVADQSPLPVLIYNMPANTAGLDLDATTLCVLAAHPNIIGVKDSAGNIAKLAVLVEEAGDDFAVFAGSAGYFLPALAVGAIGVVAALANVFPRAVCRVQELFQAGKLEQARELQARLVSANAAVTNVYGVPGLKAALELQYGYGGTPRSPLQPLTEQERAKLSDILQRVPRDV